MRKWLIGCMLTGLMFGAVGSQAAPAQSGAEIFVRHDFGAVTVAALDRFAVPWKLTAAALVLTDPAGSQDITPAHLKRRLAEFGFLWPDQFEGAQGVTVDKDQPLGLNIRTVSSLLPPVEVTVANLACSSCHSGPAYAADGTPDVRTAWLGTPNTSLDLDRYGHEATAALRKAQADPDRLISTVDALFPGTSAWERISLRWVVLPRLKARLAAIPEGGSPLPFENGSAGLTNGVSATKHGLGAMDEIGLHAVTSIPHLADRGFRSALLYDGGYSPAGETRFRPVTRAEVTPERLDRIGAISVFFTISTMGLDEKAAALEAPAGRAIFRWLGDYRPQAFPGPIDAAAAERGARVFTDHCASCHGQYDGLPDRPRLAIFPNWTGDVGTDPERKDGSTAALAERLNKGPFSKIFTAARTDTYVAAPLTGLWSSAPYLHNGSVPTLAQLMLLEPRSSRFLVGGHRLDFAALGIAGQTGEDGVRRYPSGYQAWSKPALYDTSLPGRSNAGHQWQFEPMSREQKLDLIEFLKRL